MIRFVLTLLHDAAVLLSPVLSLLLLTAALAAAICLLAGVIVLAATAGVEAQYVHHLPHDAQH